MEKTLGPPILIKIFFSFYLFPFIKVLFILQYSPPTVSIQLDEFWQMCAII